MSASRILGIAVLIASAVLAVFDFTQIAQLGSGFETILRVPIWIAVGLLGLALVLVGRRRRQVTVKSQAHVDVPKSETSSTPADSQKAPSK